MPKKFTGSYKKWDKKIKKDLDRHIELMKKFMEDGMSKDKASKKAFDIVTGHVKEARNYDREYDKYQGTEKQKKERAMRNRARREAEKEGRVHKGDGKDVHHVDGNPKGKKTHVRDKKNNRSFKRRSDHTEIIERIDRLING